ncbi:MAG: isopentenyldiphosphate isomerase, partial [Candidatus Omnitrophota bacterium]
QVDLDFSDLVNNLSEEQRVDMGLIDSSFSLNALDKDASGNSMHGLLAQLNIDSYPELKKYSRYLKQVKKFDAKQVMSELAALDSEVLYSLARTQDEQSLWLLSDNLKLLTNLIDFKLQSEDYTQIISRKDVFDITKIAGFMNQKILELKDYQEKALFLKNDFKDIIKSAQKFYELTLTRDQAFIQNAIKKIEADDNEASIMITGGYHTPNLKKQLKAQNMSFISLTPTVTHETNRPLYEELLLNQSVRITSPNNANSMSLLPVRMTNSPLSFSTLAGELNVDVLSSLIESSRMADYVGEFDDGKTMKAGTRAYSFEGGLGELNKEYWNMLNEEDQVNIHILLSQNAANEENKRSYVYELIHPFKWNRIMITEVQIKGFYVNQSQTPESHAGRGNVTANLFGPSNPDPEGGLTQKGAVNEHRIATQFYADHKPLNGTFLKVPLGWGTFPNINYKDQPLGFVIMGTPKFMTRRMKVEDMIFGKILDGLYLNGLGLRDLHNSGIGHGFYHPGNMSYNLIDTPSSTADVNLAGIHDLDSAFWLEEKATQNKTTVERIIMADLIYALVQLVDLSADIKRMDESGLINAKTIIDAFLEGYFAYLDDDEHIDEVVNNSARIFVDYYDFHVTQMRILKRDSDKVLAFLPTYQKFISTQTDLRLINLAEKIIGLYLGARLSARTPSTNPISDQTINQAPNPFGVRMAEDEDLNLFGQMAKYYWEEHFPSSVQWHVAGTLGALAAMDIDEIRSMNMETFLYKLGDSLKIKAVILDKDNRRQIMDAYEAKFGVAFEDMDTLVKNIYTDVTGPEEPNAAALWQLKHYVQAIRSNMHDALNSTTISLDLFGHIEIIMSMRKSPYKKELLDYMQGVGDILTSHFDIQPGVETYIVFNRDMMIQQHMWQKSIGVVMFAQRIAQNLHELDDAFEYHYRLSGPEVIKLELLFAFALGGQEFVEETIHLQRRLHQRLRRSYDGSNETVSLEDVFRSAQKGELLKEFGITPFVDGRAIQWSNYWAKVQADDWESSQREDWGRVKSLALDVISSKEDGNPLPTLVLGGSRDQFEALSLMQSLPDSSLAHVMQASRAHALAPQSDSGNSNGGQITYLRVSPELLTRHDFEESRPRVAIAFQSIEHTPIEEVLSTLYHVGEDDLEMLWVVVPWDSDNAFERRQMMQHLDADVAIAQFGIDYLKGDLDDVDFIQALNRIQQGLNSFGLDDERAQRFESDIASIELDRIEQELSALQIQLSVYLIPKRDAYRERYKPITAYSANAFSDRREIRKSFRKFGFDVSKIERIQNGDDSSLFIVRAKKGAEHNRLLYEGDVVQSEPLTVPDYAKLVKLPSFQIAAQTSPPTLGESSPDPVQDLPQKLRRVKSLTIKKADPILSADEERALRGVWPNVFDVNVKNSKLIQLSQLGFEVFVGGKIELMKMFSSNLHKNKIFKQINRADVNRLENAIQNVIDNLRQHRGDVPRGLERGLIGVRIVNKEGTPYLQFVYLDNGPGFVNKDSRSRVPISIAVIQGEPGDSLGGKGTGFLGVGTTVVVGAADNITYREYHKSESLESYEGFEWSKRTQSDDVVKIFHDAELPVQKSFSGVQIIWEVQSRFVDGVELEVEVDSGSVEVAEKRVEELTGGAAEASLLSETPSQRQSRHQRFRDSLIRMEIAPAKAALIVNFIESEYISHFPWSVPLKSIDSFLEQYILKFYSNSLSTFVDDLGEVELREYIESEVEKSVYGEDESGDSMAARTAAPREAEGENRQVVERALDSVRNLEGVEVIVGGVKGDIASGDKDVLDIVDERGYVIEPSQKAMQKEVHAQGLWHRVAHVYVFTPDGRLILQRRSLAKPLSPGKLQVSASGRVNAGESALDAVLRETEEELGINFWPEELIRIGKENGLRRSYDISGGGANNEFITSYAVKLSSSAQVDQISKKYNLLETQDLWILPWDTFVSTVKNDKDKSIFSNSLHGLIHNPELLQQLTESQSDMDSTSGGSSLDEDRDVGGVRMSREVEPDRFLYPMAGTLFMQPRDSKRVDKNSYDGQFRNVGLNLLANSANPISGLIDQEIKTKGHIIVADIGAGRQLALMEAKQEFGDQITTVAVDVENHLERLQPDYISNVGKRLGVELDETHRPDFILAPSRSVKFNEPPDIILAIRSLPYEEDPMLGFENLYNQLAVDGTFVARYYPDLLKNFDPSGKSNFDEPDWLFKALTELKSKGLIAGEFRAGFVFIKKMSAKQIRINLERDETRIKVHRTQHNSLVRGDYKITDGHEELVTIIDDSNPPGDAPKGEARMANRITSFLDDELVTQHFVDSLKDYSNAGSGDELPIFLYGLYLQRNKFDGRHTLPLGSSLITPKALRDENGEITLYLMPVGTPLDLSPEETMLSSIFFVKLNDARDLVQSYQHDTKVLEQKYVQGSAVAYQLELRSARRDFVNDKLGSKVFSSKRTVPKAVHILESAYSADMDALDIEQQLDLLIPTLKHIHQAAPEVTFYLDKRFAQRSSRVEYLLNKYKVNDFIHIGDPIELAVITLGSLEAGIGIHIDINPIEADEIPMGLASALYQGIVEATALVDIGTQKIDFDIVDEAVISELRRRRNQYLKDSIDDNITYLRILSGTAPKSLRQKFLWSIAQQIPIEFIIQAAQRTIKYVQRST